MMIEKTHIRRYRLILMGGLFFWLLLVGRLVYIQLERSSIFQSVAAQQQLRFRELKPNRGTVYDRRLTPLTLNLVYDSFGVRPDSLKDRSRAASLLSPLLGKSRKCVSEVLNKSGDFIWLAKKVEPSVGEQIRSLNIPGICPQRDVLRYYPFGKLAGQVIGFTNTTNCGIEGIEMDMNSALTGTPGKCIILMDANCRRYSDVTLPYDPPQDGCDIVLTLDARCQSIVEEELLATVDQYGARGAMGVVIIPRTGEILAMANIPEFDPNHVNRYNKAQRKNRVVTDLFEPGSIFKVVTAAAALQEGIVQPEDSIYAENGSFLYAGTVLHDWKKFGWVTFREAIEHSVNIAVAKIALKLGPTTFYTYATNFGFGCKTGVQFPGEVNGVLRDQTQWSGRSLITMALGQEVSVTALQMACAYGAVANGGCLMQPQIVKRVVDHNGDVIREMNVKQIRRVLRPEIAELVTQFLKGVVDRGTGVKAQVDHITVAGKTATAQKADREGYREGKYMACFVGFLPAEDPQLVGVVVIDEPQQIYWGGEVAAPTFGRIMKRIVHLPDGPVENFLLAQVERLTDDMLVSIHREAGLASQGRGELLSQVLTDE
ncbi:MAG: penicillin-binding protein 2 [Gemmatimonadota bacterium]|nr:MAG: penicillin-binding protein 2 [Gemmatimonadota bacterium]